DRLFSNMELRPSCERPTPGARATLQHSRRLLRSNDRHAGVFGFGSNGSQNLGLWSLYFGLRSLFFVREMRDCTLQSHEQRPKYKDQRPEFLCIASQDFLKCCTPYAKRCRARPIMM